MDLKQNTATNIMLLMVDSADHVTGKTGLTLAVTASKNGGSFASLNAGAVVSEVANGWYKIAVTTADTDTLGDFVLHAEAAGADPTDRALSIVPVVASDIYSRVGAPSGISMAADIAAVISEVNTHPSLAEIEASPTLAKEATAATIAAYLDTEIAAIKARTDLIPDTPAAVGSAMTLTGAYDAAKAAASQTSLDALLTTTLTESYAADGSAMTVAQALYMIWSLSQAGKSGTTLTTKRLDGVTTAMTFTLDSAVAPTTISRTS